MTPEGVYTGRDGGIPSGTGFTSLIGTLVHAWLFFYTEEYLRLYHNGSKQDVSHLGSFHGDDGVWVLPGLNPVKVSDILAPLNIKINPDKSLFNARNIQFLQRLHSLDYLVGGNAVGVRSIVRTFSGMVFPERFNDWPSEMHSVRWIAQLENCKYHPHFKNFVRFISVHDKLGLGLNYPGGIEGLFKSCGGTKSVVDRLELISYLPTQFYRGQSLSSLATVRLLNSFGAERGGIK